MEQTIIKAVIIDDEPDGRNIVALLLELLFPHIVLAGQAENVATGVALVQSAEPDLIFLDIEMPDGNAFDLLAACRESQAQVILVTAYEHYALQAIKTSVLDYLLKPVNKEEFKAAVTKALSRTKQERSAVQAISLADMYRHLMIKKLRVATLTGFSLVNIEDIICCEASGNYTIIFLQTKKALRLPAPSVSMKWS